MKCVFFVLNHHQLSCTKRFNSTYGALASHHSRAASTFPYFHRIFQNVQKIFLSSNVSNYSLFFFIYFSRRHFSSNFFITGYILRGSSTICQLKRFNSSSSAASIVRCEKLPFLIRRWLCFLNSALLLHPSEAILLSKLANSWIFLKRLPCSHLNLITMSAHHEHIYRILADFDVDLRMSSISSITAINSSSQTYKYRNIMNKPKLEYHNRNVFSLLQLLLHLAQTFPSVSI